MEFLEIDSKNIFTSLLCMINFIKARKIEKDKAINVTELQGFGEAA